MNDIQIYSDKINGFEKMTPSERRAKARRNAIDHHYHSASTLKSVFGVKPANLSNNELLIQWSPFSSQPTYKLSDCVIHTSLSQRIKDGIQSLTRRALGIPINKNTPRYQAISLAKQLVEEHAVVIDFETTDFNGVAIQAAVVCCATRNVLYSSLIYTNEVISEGAYKIHGIGKNDLVRAPSAKQVAKELDVVIGDKTIVAFNAKFDRQIAQATFPVAIFNTSRWVCAMKQVSAPVCGPSNLRHGSISLKDSMADLGLQWEGEAHDATTDSLATVDVIRAISKL